MARNCKLFFWLTVAILLFVCPFPVCFRDRTQTIARRRDAKYLSDDPPLSQAIQLAHTPMSVSYDSGDGGPRLAELTLQQRAGWRHKLLMDMKNKRERHTRGPQRDVAMPANYFHWACHANASERRLCGLCSTFSDRLFQDLRLFLQDRHYAFGIASGRKSDKW